MSAFELLQPYHAGTAGCAMRCDRAAHRAETNDHNVVSHAWGSATNFTTRQLRPGKSLSNWLRATRGIGPFCLS